MHPNIQSSYSERLDLLVLALHTIEISQIVQTCRSRRMLYSKHLLTEGGCMLQELLSFSILCSFFQVGPCFVEEPSSLWKAYIPLLNKRNTRLYLQDKAL